MARRFLTDLELLGFALLNARMHPVSANPSGLGVGDAGRVWFNTTTNRFMVWNGTAPVDALLRSNHQGQQLAATISDLATAVQAYTLDQFADAAGPVGMGGFKITGLGDGTAGSDAATYGQLLQLLNNQSFKAPVRLATTVNDTLNGLAARDGVTPVADDRVLVKDQTTPATNGIYLAKAGAWVRAEDFNTSAEAIPGTVVAVQEGTAGGDKLFMLATNGPITLGTTSLVFSPYGASSGEIGVAGAGLTKTGSTYDVGAGTGIVVAADSVAVDFTIIPRDVVGTIPTTTGTIFTVAGAVVTINHQLGNLAADLKVHAGSVPISGSVVGQPLEVEYTNIDANNTQITFPAAPAANNYTFSLQG